MNIDNFVLGLVILFLLLVVVVTIIYFVCEWLNRRRIQAPIIPFIPPENFPARPEYYRGPLYGSAIVETNSGFSEGMVLGSMMASQPVTVVNETVVNETVVNETIINEAPVVSEAAFESFDGGDNDGGGATSSWSDDSSSSSSSDSSSSSSSDSSSDSSSSDSGSGSGSDTSSDN